MYLYLKYNSYALLNILLKALFGFYKNFQKKFQNFCIKVLTLGKLAYIILLAV